MHDHPQTDDDRRRRRPFLRRPFLRRPLLRTTAAAVVLAGGAVAVPSPAMAKDDTAQFSGGAGTETRSSTLYARSGAALSLEVRTDAAVKCISGLPPGFAGAKTSSSAKDRWTFTGTAAAGEGKQTFTIGASESYTTAGACTGKTTTFPATYTVDNTGPVLASSSSPAPNAAGWTKADTTVTWTATDAGVGMSSSGGPTPASTQVTTDGTSTVTSTATDRLGNTSTATATVRLDKTAPAIAAEQTRNPDGTVTVAFRCDDAAAAGVETSGVATCTAGGGPASATTVRESGTVVGTATDRAGNIRSLDVAVEAGDSTPPTLSGTPATGPGASGWYRDDVTVRWTAADPESGVPHAPADSVITGEGTGLTSSRTVVNGAGLSTTATSAPAVRIDRTPPTTSVTGTSNDWSDGDVVLELVAEDNLSGVASTRYAVDGGPAKQGTSVELTAEGEHTVAYASTDEAGNVEDERTVVVRIDKTAPTIRHDLDPASYAEGSWTNRPVTVTFVCADQGGSGVADCTAPATRSDEGEHAVTGTARDGAGHIATDTATVRIDTTEPTLESTVTGVRNDAGWYREEVAVGWTATDALSGVAGSPERTVLGEGRGQRASATVTDAAGNTATASVSGIDVDTTAPVLTARVPDGWHRDDVTVAWSCTDALSGVAEGPEDSVVTGEGADLSASASCTDVAGNTAVKTVSGIRIDRTAPTTTAEVAAPTASGWYGAPVRVTLHGADNLDEAVTTSYRVDDGEVRTYAGPFTVGEGEHTVSFWSKDRAGNAEEPGAPLELQVDTTAPRTTLVQPISPDSGWFVTSGIPVAFAATDAGSGVAATYLQVDGGAVRTYGEPFVEDLSTGTHTITYWSVDAAGNAEEKSSTQTVQVRVDTQAPTISGRATPAPNAHGWNNADVAVRFTCEDVGSGLVSGMAGCAGDTDLVNEGTDQKVVGDAVDVAGNRSTATVDGIRIDRTPPTLTGVPDAANAAGWHRDDVTVTWVGDDALAGIDPASQPAPTRVTGEGADLTAGPQTVKDLAGNESAPASVSGIRIDRTAPVVTGAPTTKPVDGWFRGEVVVDFTCSDALSGVASCPTSAVVRGDGADQSVTSEEAADVAGNVAGGTTVRDIDIDGTAPTTTAVTSCAVSNGYCKGGYADVVLTSVDQPGLSGVKEIRYTVSGGTEQVLTGASGTVRVPLTGAGSGSVTYYAVDRAGNKESANGVALRWDDIAPTVTHTLTPKPNADGWNNADVTVTFTAKDNDPGSKISGLTAPVKVTRETAGQVVTGSAKDAAGNLGTDAVTVKLDKTAPTITGKVTAGKLGANGWYVGPVTVSFTCSDALSGVAACPDPVVLTANGTSTARGTATDKAGNTATATVAGIRIDQEKPALTAADVNVAGRTYTLGAVPAAICRATDAFSGLASCAVKVTGGNASGVGTFTWTATATDKAGNTTALTGTYQVVYRFSGFLAPIADTTHRASACTSTIKAGSTVPVKLQLMRADGTPVKAATAPAWLTPVKGGSTAAPADTTTSASTVDTGTAYRYDSTARQYVYNWKTPSTGGAYWRIGATLDDGRTYYVNVGLR